MNMTSIFTKIIERQIQAEIVREYDDMIVIRDANPQAKTHLLIIPKKEIPTLNDIRPEDRECIANMLYVAKEIAHDLGIQQ
jgi:histidine triad (HIT) family protein